MTDDIVHIDGQAWRILDRQNVRYPYTAETEQERKARGSGPVPEVAYMSCKIERVKDEQGS